MLGLVLHRLLDINSNFDEVWFFASKGRKQSIKEQMRVVESGMTNLTCSVSQKEK